MKHHFLLSSLMLLLLASLSCCNLFAQNYTDSLNIELQQIQQENSISGFAVSVVNKDQILYQEGFGYADIAAQKPYTPQTIHNIGSTSKTFIAVALMKLVEEGKLKLNQPINDFLPFKVVHPRYPNTPITIRHLATHTSGITDSKNYIKACYVSKETFGEEQEKALPRELRRYMKYFKNSTEQNLGILLENYLLPNGSLYLKKNFNKHQPGNHYEYANVGSALAAYVVEMVAKQDYRDYVREQIFLPIGMQSSGWTFEEIDMDAHATLYATNQAVVPKYTLNTYPDGGVLTNCNDLSLYLKAMMQGYFGESPLLNPESFQEMMQLQFEGEEKVGIFWSIDKRGAIGHNGADPGIFTFMYFNPDNQLGGLFMSNTSVFESDKHIAEFVKVWKVIVKYREKLVQEN